MATRLNDRLLRGEVIMPWVIQQVWQKRDVWNTKEERQKRMEILHRFLEEDLERFPQYEANAKLDNYFHPSSAGSCLRALWFSQINAPVSVSLGVEKYCIGLRRFETGDMYHFRFSVLFEYLGILRKREHPFILEKEQMCGKCDAIVEVGGEEYLVDIKSAAPRYFMEMCRNNSAGDQYELQLQIYLAVFGIKKGAIIVECKETHQVREFPIKASKKVFDYALARKNSLQKHVKNLTPPDREGYGISQPPCSWCDYCSVCYIDGKVLECAEAERKRREANVNTKKPNKFAQAIRNS